MIVKPQYDGNSICTYCGMEAAELSLGTDHVLWCAAGHVICITDGVRIRAFNFHDPDLVEKELLRK